MSVESGEAASGGELVGKVLGGRYRVTSVIGRGGMGVVARAVDEVLGREVAVKILRAFTDTSTFELRDLRDRMQREAQAAARIRHGGVVTVHDVAEDGGLPVIVMELVDGPSLDDVLAERGTLEPQEAAAIGAKLMDALDAAHRAGVLHRDVKPGNVLLEHGGGRVVLTDFGIASMGASGDDAVTKLTRSGDLVGSLDYLPPERAQGREPGPASDIWSLGMTLHAAVEGTWPFRRTSVWSTLTAIVTEPLPEPVQAGALTPVLRALMAKDPESRPDAGEAREMLEEIASGGTVQLGLPPDSTGTLGALGAPEVPSTPGAANSAGGAGALGAAGAAGVPSTPGAAGAANVPGTPGPAANFPSTSDTPGTPGTPGTRPPGTEGTAAPAGAFGPPPAEPGGQPTQSAQQPGGAAQFGQFGQPPGGAVAHPAGGAAQNGGSARRRGRGRPALVAGAAVAAVLLVGGGVTYALTDNDSGPQGGQAGPQSTRNPSATDTEKPGAGHEKSPQKTPSASASRDDTPHSRAPAQRTSRPGGGKPTQKPAPGGKPTATGGGSAPSRPPAGPAGPKPPSKSCGGWKHKNPKPGTYGIMSGSYHLMTGPYQRCSAVTLAKSGTKLWYHCSVVNAQGNNWTHVRIAGTTTEGWMSNDNLTRQNGPSIRC